MAVFKPGESADDCYAQLAAESVTLAGAACYFGNFAEGDSCSVGVRFTNVTIPQGSVITSAKVTFQSYANDTGTTCSVQIKGEDTDDASTFSDVYSEYTGRTRTSEYVDWSSIGSWTIDTDYDSPDITDIIKEIVDRALWVSGNDLVLFFADASSSLNAHRAVKSYDTSTTLCARLTVTWEGEAAGDLNVSKKDTITANEVGDVENLYSEVNQVETIFANETRNEVIMTLEVSRTETITAKETVFTPSTGILYVYKTETITQSETRAEQRISFGYEYHIHIISPLPQVFLGDCNISLVIPLPILSVEGIDGIFDIHLPIPLPQLSVGGLVGEIGELSFRTPFPSLSVIGKPDVLGNLIDLRMPFPTLSLVGKIGELADIDITFPFPTLVVTDLPLVVGNIHIISPFISVNMHGDVIPVTFNRRAIVMNTSNYAVSHYINYNFNSLTYFKAAKVFIGANEQGVYILDGNDDLGQKIEAEIKSGVRDLGGNGAIAIPRETWLAYRSDGEIELDVKTDEHDDLPPIIFDKIAHAVMESRKKMGRGIKARFFTWKLKNVEGSNFSLESLRILGDIIRRKTR